MTGDPKIQCSSGQRYDAAVIGGSFAGSAAALYLAHARRSVMVFDEANPRNHFATEDHGFLGLYGLSPVPIREKAHKHARQLHESLRVQIKIMTMLIPA